MKDTSRLYQCALCKCQVIICSDCDRGNIYCSKNCSRRARKKFMREAGARYQNSKWGRIKHAARQMRYRERKRKKVTHQGSVLPKASLGLKPVASRASERKQLTNRQYYCHHCYREVGKFLRHGLLNYVTKKTIHSAGVYTLGP